ncbi:MAG TPA: hypothetical protein VI278_16420 [Nitrososphaeraceae archaeon]
MRSHIIQQGNQINVNSNNNVTVVVWMPQTAKSGTCRPLRRKCTDFRFVS